MAGALRTASFGSASQSRFKMLKDTEPDGPTAVMELWCGWFDTWGAKGRVRRSASNFATELADVLASGASANIFAFHGGTSFGFDAGANLYHEFEPHVTSYDYDALLTEDGQPTPKYHACREVIARHTGRDLHLGEAGGTSGVDDDGALTAADGPSSINVVLDEVCPMLDSKTLGLLASERITNVADGQPGVRSAAPQSIEALGEGNGCVGYSSRLGSASGLRTRCTRAHATPDTQPHTLTS